jgi:hypothetical protein
VLVLFYFNGTSFSFLEFHVPKSCLVNNSIMHITFYVNTVHLPLGMYL